ncbi:hypothetical protein CASFOL_031398 [Castilleja foliolosa]|uniref:S-protein homolog n=1 Tax=Castilleja foliolosa TaxID=1961234 RepID=A0ABD3C7C7_9LAMI
MKMRNFLAYVILATFFLHQIDACVTQQYELRISNNIHKAPVLTFLCKPGDGLLEYTALRWNTYKRWTFCQDIYRATKYTCDIQWGPKRMYIEIFNEQVSRGCDGGLCNWVALPDGMYFKGRNSGLVKKYNW